MDNETKAWLKRLDDDVNKYIIRTQEDLLFEKEIKGLLDDENKSFDLLILFRKEKNKSRVKIEFNKLIKIMRKRLEYWNDYNLKTKSVYSYFSCMMLSSQIISFNVDFNIENIDLSMSEYLDNLSIYLWDNYNALCLLTNYDFLAHKGYLERLESGCKDKLLKHNVFNNTKLN